MTKTPAAGGKLAVNIAGTLVNIPGLESIPGFGPAKSYYENTAIDDAGKTYGAELPDPGEGDLTGSWDSTNLAHNYLMAQSTNASALDWFKAFFKSGATATFQAIIGSFRTSANKGQDEKFECHLRLSGGVTYNAAGPVV